MFTLYIFLFEKKILSLVYFLSFINNLENFLHKDEWNNIKNKQYPPPLLVSRRVLYMKLVQKMYFKQNCQI